MRHEGNQNPDRHAQAMWQRLPDGQRRPKPQRLVVDAHAEYHQQDNGSQQDDGRNLPVASLYCEALHDGGAIAESIRSSRAHERVGRPAPQRKSRRAAPPGRATAKRGFPKGAQARANAEDSSKRRRSARRIALPDRPSLRSPRYSLTSGKLH